jgi:hypothetical protein
MYQRLWACGGHPWNRFDLFVDWLIVDGIFIIHLNNKDNERHEYAGGTINAICFHFFSLTATVFVVLRRKMESVTYDKDYSTMLKYRIDRRHRPIYAGQKQVYVELSARASIIGCQER